MPSHLKYEETPRDKQANAISWRFTTVKKHQIAMLGDCMTAEGGDRVSPGRCAR